MGYIDSIQKRIMFISLIGTLTGIIILGIYSLYSLIQTRQRDISLQLSTMLTQFSIALEQEYDSMLRLSEQMIPSEPVGVIFGELQNAQDSHELGAAKRKLIKSLSVYSGTETIMIVYSDAEDGSVLFSNYTLSGERFNTKQALVYENEDIGYHVVHASLSNFTDAPAVSLSRFVYFAKEQIVVIYIEKRTRILKTLAEMEKTTGIKYAFAQTDRDGVIRFTTDESVFELGTRADIGANGAYKNGYCAGAPICANSASVLLYQPNTVIKADVLNHMGQYLLLLLLALCVSVGASAVINLYLFKGLKLFEREMDSVIDGNLNKSDVRTNMKEIDRLLDYLNNMKQKIYSDRVERAEFEQIRRVREREILIYQINPHFLLNTLNAVHWLAAINNQPKISRAIFNLSAILIYSLGRNSDTPSLEGEIQILRQYLEIELMRHDFNVQIDISPGDYLKMATPVLILQPIVENAISHAIDENGNLSITLRFDKDENKVIIVVEDDGLGISEDKLADLNRPLTETAGAAEGRVGIRYVRTVLQDKYGENATLRFENRPTGGARVTLTLPYVGDGEKYD